MGMVIVFLSLAAVLGTVCYLVIRRLFWDAWTEWRQGRQEVHEDQRRQQHTQALRREALDSVLAQINRQDDPSRRTA